MHNQYKVHTHIGVVQSNGNSYVTKFKLHIRNISIKICITRGTRYTFIQFFVAIVCTFGHSIIKERCGTIQNTSNSNKCVQRNAQSYRTLLFFFRYYETRCGSFNFTFVSISFIHFSAFGNFSSIHVMGTHATSHSRFLAIICAPVVLIRIA